MAVHRSGTELRHKLSCYTHQLAELSAKTEVTEHPPGVSAVNDPYVIQ